MNSRRSTTPEPPAGPLTLVSLGSNLDSTFGSSQRTVELAIEALLPLSSERPRASSLWQTEPVDCPAGSPLFINAVAMFPARQDLSAADMLRHLLAIETRFGRCRDGTANAARPLDLDLLAFGDFCLQSAGLTLPHPRAHLRAFVLRPLAELEPDYVFPGMQLPVTSLLQALPDADTMRRLPGNH